MNLTTCLNLAANLEANLHQLPAFYDEIEEAIGWLMDRTFESTSKAEKQELAAVELRLRLVLDRFKKERVN